jgi:hypothetical protein
MCHHGELPTHDAWLREAETDDAEAESPSFANEEADVDVELLEADDD